VEADLTVTEAGGKALKLIKPADEYAARSGDGVLSGRQGTCVRQWPVERYDG